jgi:hypothetical protein
MPHCKLKNCPYDRDGRCVENQLPNCPNLLPDAPVDLKHPELAGVTDVQTPSGAPTYEAFYSGKKLTADEATPILQSDPQVVVLGGMVESGKTTLIARIFEMFQCGAIAGYRFMASRTPVEFDKLCWHATMECGAARPTTEHTYRSENNLFLHLRVRQEDEAASPTDILIGDIPGEVFPEAVAEESVCRDLYALRRANHLVLFLDSGVLCDTSKRHDHCGKVFDFVVRALQTGQVGQHTVLHLVISKCDLLPNKTASEVMLFVEKTEQKFRTKFAARVGGLSTWKLAARPVHPFPPTLAAINDVFRSWTIRATPHGDAFMKAPQRSSFSRDFCRFGL